MGLIEIEGMEFYSYHGHFKQERIVGNKFIINLKLETNTLEVEKSDDINDALNYQVVYEIIKEKMKEKSHLLENIASKILDAIYTNLGDKIITSEIKVSKINPPMGGQIAMVSITLKR